MPYRGSYELELDYGFALLEQLEGPEGAYQYRPSEGDDVYDSIYFGGVFGGRVDPDAEQDFVVYSLDWPEDVDEDVEEEHLATLSEELDSLFSGWVLDESKTRVYILREGESLR